MEKLRSFPAILYKRKLDVGVVVIWSVLISIMLIYNFHSFYLENQFTIAAYQSPAFANIERLVIAIVGFVATLTISDVKRTVYSYFMAMALVFIISVLSVFAYIWSVLQIGLALQEISFGWEVALLSAVIKVFGFMFPIGFIFSLIGVVAGTSISFLYKYS